MNLINKPIPSIVCTLTLSMLSAHSIAQDERDIGEVGDSPYEVVTYWAEPFAEKGFAFGGASGVLSDHPGRLIVSQRGETRIPLDVPRDFHGFAGELGISVLTEGERRTWQNCIFVLDANGNVVDVWEHLDYLCEGADGPGPERIRVSPYDPERKLWVINQTHHQIYVLANDGSELLATYGEKGEPGKDATHYGSPQDVAFMPDGRILVADGLINNRVVVYDNEMNYLTEFGSEGTVPGGTNGIHSLSIGPEGRIFVLDRSGYGVNIWRTGESYTEFSFERRIDISGMALDVIVNKNDFWMTAHNPLRFINFDFEGNQKYTWIVPAELPDGFREVHSFSVSSEGIMYGGDNIYGRPQKWVAKPGASPELLIEPPWVGY